MYAILLALVFRKEEIVVEIINPNSLPGNNARSCGSDVFAPNHQCYDGGCNGKTNCFTYTPDPCSKYQL
jgi:hypothetical protein